MVANAASGTWTNDASSVWSTTANWLNGVVANGTDATADFSTIDITASRSVTLDSSRTIGNINFADTNGVQSWVLNSSGGSLLTLATSSGTPTITTLTNGANTYVATITAPLAGTAGLAKAGNGIVALGGTNSYSGATAINAGTLQLTNIASTNVVLFPVTPAPVLYMSFDNISNSTVINQGSGGAAMNGTLNGTASIASGLGEYGNALSITAGAASGGSVLVNNAVVQLNGSATGNWTVGMWLKSKTPGGAYFYSGAGGWVSGNTKFFLIQNAFNNDGNGTHAGGVSNSRSWEAGTAVVADGNWHFIVMTCNSGVISQYVDGAVDTLVYNQWTTANANASSQVRVGGVPTVTDGEIGLNGLIDEFYMFTNGLSQAQVQSLMNFSSLSNGPQQSVPLPAATAVTVAAPATLDLNGISVTVASLSGAGLVTTKTAVGNQTLIISNNGSSTFSGIITNSVGILSVMQMGSGNMTLSGTNNYTGITTLNGGTLNISGVSLNTNATIVNAGTLNITGSLQPLTTAAPSSYMVVGNGRVNFSGAFLTNYNFNIGSTTNAVGAFYQTAGVLKESQGANGSAFQLGSAQGGYGYYYIGAGATNFCGEIGVGGEVQPSGNGVMDVNGGTVIDTGYIVVCRNGTGNNSLVPQSGVFNVYPGSSIAYCSASGNQFALNWGASQTSTVNMMGGIVTNTFNNITFNLNQSGNAANTGILNLNGGILQAGWVSGGANGTRVNFNGGTLQAAENQAVMMQGLAAANVYGGGGTFNNNGFNATIGQQLLAPTGSGVNTIASFTGGAGYIAPPIVAVVNDPGDSTGVGATAIAQIDASTGGPTSGRVTNIVITCSGVNYTATPTFTLSGGGATTPATITGAAPTANTVGGMTFTGSGITTLSGGYTYTGATRVLAGTLSLISATVIPSVAGNIVVTNATLTVDSSSGTALPVNNLTLTNSILNVTAAAAGTGVSATGSIIFQNIITNNINYGTIAINPTAPVLNVGGGLVLSGSSVVINISAFGLQAGSFPLIKYTGTALGSLANFTLGTLPPGVVAALVNNTGNDSIDLNITSTGQNLSWYGLDGVTGLINSNWGINTPTNWVSVGTTTPQLRYQEYTSGGVTVGDPVTLDDTLYNDFSNPQPTNINLTTSVRPFQFVVNSTLPYSIGGVGSIIGLGSIVKSNTGSLNLNTSNNFSGGLFVTGGSVIITNDAALGTNTGTVTLNTGTLQINGSTTNNSRVIAVPATSSIAVATNVFARFGGAVTGAGGLTKTDNGTLVLAGTNGITGTLTVNQGTLTTLGTNVLAAVPLIGNSAGFNGVLNVAGGVFQDNNNPANVFNTSLTIGNVASAAGDMTVSSGTVTIPKQLTIGPTTYGGFSQSGGTTTIGGFIALGGSASGAVLNQTGGTINMTNTSATIGYSVTTSFGVMNLSGSAVFNVSGAGNGIWPGEVGNGVLNVSGSAALTITNDGIVLGRGNAAANGTANLNGGTTTVNSVSKGTGFGTLNFNGGTLKAERATNAFVAGLTSAYVYGGGATIDDGGFAITIPQALVSASGAGVSSISLVNGGSGYIDSPIVTISGGNGSNATATATVSGGAVTAIVITSPGIGYSLADSLSVAFSGGGANVVQPTVNTVNLANNSAGSFAKRGSGTTTLSAANAIGGNVNVNAGTLSISTASQILGTTTVTNGAVFSVSQVTTNTGSISNLTLGVTSGSGATLGLALASGNTASPFLNCGTLTLNASNNVALAGRFTVGTFPIIKYVGAVVGAGSLTNVILPQGVVGYVSNNVPTSTIYAVITSTGPGLVWAGFNTSPALTNLWDINSTTNWTLSGNPTTYQESVPPGDAVTFNDTGSGTVNMSNTISPFSMVISNTSKAYTYRGTGRISGNGGIVKLGTNAVFMNLTNNAYTGDTVISNGFVQLGSASALSAGANLFVGAGATLELNGYSQTTPQFTGGGIVDNNSANNVALTIGSGGGGTWSGTIQDQGAGGVSLSKSGNNTLILSGTNNLNSTANPAAQFNGGTTIITNNGVLNCANTEFWVMQNAGTATCIVDGGTLNVNSTYLVIGRNNAAANGTLILNNGKVQKSGANVVVIGSLGSIGSLVVNGGQFLNNSEIWLGEGATANASLYLNGGLLQATDIRPNGATPASYNAYFNGGTLQASASSANFLQVFCNVMSNGLILDDNGFTLSIGGATLASGDGFNGGLFKKGSGSVYLDANNTYTGTTVVTNGTLAGVGSVTGPLVVSPAGNLGAGDAGATVGTFTINNNLTLQGKATLRVNKTGGTPVQDNVTVTGNINYTGSTLAITNITSDATPLTTSDTFQLFSVSGSVTGSPTVTGSPGSGLAYSFNPANGLLSIVTSSIASYPTNITATVSGSTLSLSWPTTHLGWILQAQTNNLSNGLKTNWVDWPGSTSVTQTNIGINPANPTVFFRLKHP